MPARCQRLASAGPQRGAGQRVDQAAVDVEDPAGDDRRCRRSAVRSSRWAGVGRHYWYTLFAMKNPWDRRLGFWYLAGNTPDSAGRRGLSVGCDADLRGARRASPPARARPSGHGVSRPATSSPMRCRTTSTSSSGSWPPRRAVSSPSRSTRRSRERGPADRRPFGRSGRRRCTRDFADRADQLVGHRIHPAPRGGRWCTSRDCDAIESLVEGQPTDRADRTASSASRSRTRRGPRGSPRPSFGRGRVDHRSLGGRRPRRRCFGHAFQFQPLTGVHLVSAGMHHGGCQGFYLGALNVGQAPGHPGQVRPGGDAGDAIDAAPGDDGLHGADPVRPASCACPRGEGPLRRLEPARSSSTRPHPARSRSRSR